MERPETADLQISEDDDSIGSRLVSESSMDEEDEITPHVLVEMEDADVEIFGDNYSDPVSPEEITVTFQNIG